MHSLADPIILTGKKVILEPLDTSHFDELISISKNKRIWEFYSKNCAETDILVQFLNDALQQKVKSDHYPFVVRRTDTGDIIGTTRYGNIDLINKRVEIGWTWYTPDVWGTGYNEECKLLLLTYAFEVIGTMRVELKTWERNTRSRNAIERIGATFEGILRHHMLNDNGIKRNSVYYSIIDDEWADRKLKLQQLVNEKYASLV